MSNTYQSAPPHKTPPKDTQQHASQTLSLVNASNTTASGAAAKYHEQTVHRAWGPGDGSGYAHGPTNQHSQHRSVVAPMMQRWLGESQRQQPYNNIGSVVAVNNGGKGVQDGGNEEATKARE